MDHSYSYSYFRVFTFLLSFIRTLFVFYIKVCQQNPDNTLEITYQNCSYLFSIQFYLLDLASHFFSQNFIHKLFHFVLTLFKHLNLLLARLLNAIFQPLAFLENGLDFIKLFRCFGLERFQILVHLYSNFLRFFRRSLGEKRLWLDNLVKSKLQINRVPFKPWAFWIDPQTKISMLRHGRKALLIWVHLRLFLLIFLYELIRIEANFPSTKQALCVEIIIVFIDEPAEKLEAKCDLDMMRPIQFVCLVDWF